MREMQCFLLPTFEVCFFLCVLCHYHHHLELSVSTAALCAAHHSGCVCLHHVEHKNGHALGKCETLAKASTSLRSSSSLLVQLCVYVTISRNVLHHQLINVSLHPLRHIYEHLVHAWQSPNMLRHASEWKGSERCILSKPASHLKLKSLSGTNKH